MADLLLRNFALLDPLAGALRGGHQALVRNSRFAEVRAGAIEPGDARVLDLGGRTLMPGLIDCHVHITSARVAWALDSLKHMLPSLLTATAGELARAMLMRGFTTVRDAAGADAGHRQAIAEGLLSGPRLFIAGRAISQTGGHGDPRPQADLAPPCECVALNGTQCRIADGGAEVLRAVRDEIRQGADQIKIMASGGVSSPTDPMHYLQYSMDELRAACDEARRSNTYVMAHAYTAEAIGRAVEAGVRTIEHGNMIDERAARAMRAAGAYLVPTLITYRALAEQGAAMGFAPSSVARAKEVLAHGSRSLEIARRAGVKMAFGSDLLGELQVHQSEEFAVRAEVLPPAEIIRSATVIAAEVLCMEGQLGVIAPGAFADAIAVDGDPLADLRLLGCQGDHLALIMKDGAIHKNRLDG